MADSWESLCNQALRKIGARKRIGSAYEGSEVAKACLEVFGQTRDELLQRGEWPWAMREVSLSPAPSPPFPWPYEYVYPQDCLRIRYVQPAAVADIYDPQPTLFLPYNDSRIAAPSRAILANISPATLVYVGRVTSPSAWDAGFTRAFIAALAEHLTIALASLNLLPQEAASAEANRDSAMVVDDTVAPPRYPGAVERQDGQQR